MKEAIREIVASVTGDIVLPPKFGTYFTFGNYINIPITKASGAIGIKWQIKENGIVIDGQDTTLIDKISIYVTDNQSHEYNVSARSVGVDKDGNTIYSDWVTIDVEYISYSEQPLYCQTNYSVLCDNTKNIVKEEPFIKNPATDEKEPATDIKTIQDPVDVTTGNFAYSHTDININTAGVPFKLIRTYNSLDIQRGWSFNTINTMDTTDINNIQVH